MRLKVRTERYRRGLCSTAIKLIRGDLSVEVSFGGNLKPARRLAAERLCLGVEARGSYSWLANLFRCCRRIDGQVLTIMERKRSDTTSART